MPTFELAGPDGQIYEVDAPDQKSAIAAFSKMGNSQPEGTPYSGSFLPFSKDAQGNVSFDSDAGIVGALKKALVSGFTLPGDVAQGKVDPLGDEAIARSTELAAMATPINPAVRAGSRFIPGVTQQTRRAKVDVPTAQELLDVGGEGFNAMRSMNVDFKTKAVNDMALRAQQELQQKGFIPETAPATSRILKKLQEAPENSVAPLSGLDAARRSLNNVGPFHGSNSDPAAASMVREILEDFITGANPKDVVAGPAPAASKILKEALGNYAAGKRSQTVTGIGDSAEIRAAAANSGKNLGNSTRSRIASLLENQKRSRGFSASEKELLESIVKGSKSANFTRSLGNLLGGGGGLGSLASGTVGATFGGAAGAVGLPAMGYASKQISNKLTKRALAAADKEVRKRSPLYQKRLQNAPIVHENLASPEAMIRALLLATMPE